MGAVLFLFILVLLNIRNLNFEDVLKVNHYIDYSFWGIISFNFLVILFYLSDFSYLIDFYLQPIYWCVSNEFIYDDITIIGFNFYTSFKEEFILCGLGLYIGMVCSLILVLRSVTKDVPS